MVYKKLLKNMRGIILAGGLGTRFKPLTDSISKHFLPIYDKPVIYYSLSLLFIAKIKDILLICKKNDLSHFKASLGNGKRFGVKISYAIQEKPKGIAEALIIGKKFVGKDNVCLILGDNFFYGQSLSSTINKAKNYKHGARILALQVNNPNDFGVINFRKNKIISIEEKPLKPKSNFIIPGMYFYDNKVLQYIDTLKPSKRNELEITDLNKIYLKKNKLKAFKLGRGVAWLDTGNPDNLLSASNFVYSVEKLQGFKIACLEEIALKNKWISKNKLIKSIDKKLLTIEYYKYIKNL